MDELKIIILNLEKMSFKNQNNGVVNEFTKVTYASPVPDEDRFSGFAILECYNDIKNFDILKGFVGKPYNAKFRKIRLKNGFKYSLVSIDDKELI